MADTLPLKQFIEFTLMDICEAIENSRDKFAYIAPKYSNNPDDGKATLIEFDVAVAVTDVNNNTTDTKEVTKGHLGVGVLSMGAKISSDEIDQEKASGEKTFSKVSRIKFNVPVHFRLDEKLNKKRLETIEKNKQRSMKPIDDGW